MSIINVLHNNTAFRINYSMFFFFSSRRRHTRWTGDWSSDVCSSDLIEGLGRQLDPDLDLWNTAKPFLEKWMLEQVGTKRLWESLKEQAPRYAKVLPDLPRLLHQYLQHNRSEERRVGKECRSRRWPHR